MKCELYQFYPEVYPFNLWIYVGKDVSGMVECFNNDFSYVYNSMGATITVPYGGCKSDPCTGFLIFLGEKVIKSEPFCYLVGWVAGKCEEVKKGKVRDKLIWESK